MEDRESGLEADLIALARQGDMAAFERLVERHGIYIYNLALHMVNYPVEAEDITQEVFIRVWKGLRRYRGSASFKTWLYRIVTNVCFSRLPRLKQELSAFDPADEQLALPAADPPVEQILQARELAARLGDELAALPAGYRYLLNLRHLQGLTYEEISQVTGMPLGTVKTGLFRARRRLKAALLLDKRMTCSGDRS